MRRLLFLFACLFTISVGVMSAQSAVNGTVVSAEDGEPIIGASIMVKGTTQGTISDMDGKFTIDVPSSNKTLVVSYIGLKAIEVEAQDNMVIELVTETSELEEVMVVAFGTAKKEAFTGSATVVKSEDITKVQGANVAQSLVGKVAGLQTSASSGEMGSSPSIRIRGFGSINAGQSPLWVVDGMPYDGDMDNINPSDIESVTVLKDAASSALYGARGANGVILVTTKKGETGEARIKFDAKAGVNSKALESYNVISDPGMYYETHYQALNNYYTETLGSAVLGHQEAANRLTGNGGGGLGYNAYTLPAGQGLIGTNGKLNPNATLGAFVTGPDGKQYYVTPDNWLGESYHTGIRQEYNVSASTSSSKGSFYASLGYLDNTGIIDNSAMNRTTARLKADHQVKEWLKVGANMSYTNYMFQSGNTETSSSSTGNLFAFATGMAPIYPVYVRDANKNILIDDNGHKVYDFGNAETNGLTRPNLGDANALALNELDKDYSEGNAFTAQGFTDFSFTKDLKLTINGAVGVDEYRTTSVANQYYGQFVEQGGSITKQHSRNYVFNTQQLLNYKKEFGVHNVDVLVGHEYYMNKGAVVYGAKSNIFSDDNDELSGAVVDSKNAGSYTSFYNAEGFLGRLQYDYDSKYFASASYRRDASSRFLPENRWGNFWSVGGAWLMNKEAFMSDVNFVDMLKLKASYGSQGNDAIGDLRYTDYYSLENNDGEIAVVFSSKGNPEITWETNKNFNVGAEFGLFDERLTGGVEYFHRTTSDMLFAFQVPSMNGYTSFYDNIGNMVNSGIELELFGDIVRTRNFVWNASFNATHVKNEVTYLAEENKVTEQEGYNGYVSGTKFVGEGLSLYTYRLREYAGVDQVTGKSLWYKNVLDADKKPTGERETTDVYSSADYYLQGSAIPDLYGGFSTGIEAYGFDVSVAFTYQIGGQAYDYGYAAFMGSPISNSTGSNYHVDMLNAWTPGTSDASIPRLQYGDEYTNASSNRFLTDASYLNIQNVNIGYTFSKKLLRKIDVESLRLFVVADNLQYWSKRKGFDPRYSFSGDTNEAAYSPVRSISGGLSLTF